MTGQQEAMSSTHDADPRTNRGSYVDHGGRPAVRFRRSYGHPADRIWAAITAPGELARWFPSQVRMEPMAGGAIEFSGDPNMPSMNGTILACEQPRRLAFTWGGNELHFEIEPQGGHGSMLTLTDVLDARDAAARNAAGWEVCLAELGKHLSELAPHGPHSVAAESWQQHYDWYVAAGMPSGAAIPGS
jgi:uncharacterized protein YndB with AHSA1/START domain